MVYLRRDVFLSSSCAQFSPSQSKAAGTITIIEVPPSVYPYSVMLLLVLRNWDIISVLVGSINQNELHGTSSSQRLKGSHPLC